ncbi:hypothetical protein ACMD2_15625 [Ananas comosus]|uniref:Uncharacterized protein n=1 Tax=Ananas comosus TaxID=4615 RepID=A0A199W1S5_ANACO|nr:hypothetical protein ACMD2_15625 [Ananas comosus]
MFNRYHLRLQWILKRWPEHGIPDALLKGIFIDGLREGFQEWVVTQKPETLAEAVGLAMSWERAEGVREARRRLNKATAEDGGNRKCGFCGETGHEEGACEVRRRMRELWLSSKYNGGGGGCGGGGGGGGGGSVVRREGEEGGVVERVESLRRSRSTKSTCQCWKHQCWKKVERSNSAFGEGVDGCQGDG